MPKPDSIDRIDKKSYPRHIGFIMDGNGRWAKKRGMPRKFGHNEGAKNFKKIVDYCHKIGIECISFYAFSTENWKRPADEVEAIIKLFREYLDDVRAYIDKKVRVIFLGDKSAFDDDLQKKMLDLEYDSKDFTTMTLMIAVNYGGRDEIVRAAKKLAEKACKGEISAESIDEEMFGEMLDTRGIPDADLVIRPSGEMRLSNFLIWQCAYAEFYFTNVLWPDFSPKELNKAIVDFASRGRRFGGV